MYREPDRILSDSEIDEIKSINDASNWDPHVQAPILKLEHPDGRPVVLTGVAREAIWIRGPVTLLHDDERSQPANRFHLPDGRDFVIGSDEMVHIYRDAQGLLRVR